MIRRKASVASASASIRKSWPGSGPGTARKSCRPWPSSLPVTMGAGSGRRTCAGWSSSPPLSRRNQLSRQLSWSHFVLLQALKEPMQRDYYAQMAGIERWSVRTLRERIDSMLYERTALSKKPDTMIARELATMRDAQRISPSLVMREPYILDFLGLRDTWQDGDLEAAIIREMESFLLELGVG